VPAENVAERSSFAEGDDDCALRMLAERHSSFEENVRPALRREVPFIVLVGRL
jgi:hypothetical protein